MRPRDQAKYDAIQRATIHLTTTLGFDGISIAKIAKRAQVSPATIYIYFQHKEDLFTKLYIDIRHKMDQVALHGLHEAMPIEDAFKTIWYNSFTNSLNHPEYLLFREQFEQTTMMRHIHEHDFKAHRYIIQLLRRGIDDHIIKNYPLPMLTAFAYFPLITLLKFHRSNLITMDDPHIHQAIDLAWTTLKKPPAYPLPTRTHD